MKHGYFAAIGCACLLGLALISCDPVGAVEIGVDDQTGIYDYLDTGAQNLQQIDFSLDSDEDGNRSVRLKIYGLQKLAISEQSGIYENMDFSAAPDTVMVSGAGVSGLYVYHDELKSGIISLPSPNRSGAFTFFSSSDMTLTVIPSNATNTWTSSSAQGSATWSIGFGVLQSASDISLVSSNTTLQSNFVVPSRVAPSVRFRSPLTQNTPPIWSPGSFVADGSGSLPNQTLIGLGEDLSLPVGNVGSSEPWNYYNDVLLPYMEEEFPGFDEYFIFPDGYNPPEPPPQVPTEFPTLPGYDFDIQPNGTLPADAGNTAYDMPDVPIKVVPVPSFDLTKINPAEIIAPFASGLQGIWALISDTLVSFDLLPVVSLCFLVLIITAFLALGVK